MRAPKTGTDGELPGVEGESDLHSGWVGVLEVLILALNSIFWWLKRRTEERVVWSRNLLAVMCTRER